MSRAESTRRAKERVEEGVAVARRCGGAAVRVSVRASVPCIGACIGVYSCWGVLHEQACALCMAMALELEVEYIAWR